MGSIRITADTTLSTKPCRLFSVELKSNGVASVLALLNGSGGSEYAFVEGTASKGARFSWEGGMLFPAGIHADVDANMEYAVLNFEVLPG